MRRVKLNDNAPAKSSKRKVNKPVTGGADEITLGPKPGLESPHPHIAQDHIGRNDAIAAELTRALNETATRSVYWRG